MRRFKDLSIKSQLRRVITLTCVISLTIAGVFFLLHDYRKTHAQAGQDLLILANVTAENTTASLAFSDPESAGDLLRSLSTTGNVICARLYDAQGVLFARFLSEEHPCPTGIPSTPGYLLLDGSIAATQNVILDDQRIGTLQLFADTSYLQARVLRFARTVAMVLIVVTLISFLLASRMQLIISQPIDHLTKAAHAIRKDSSYLLRAKTDAGGELGVLTDAFNEMLDEIQARDSQLQKAKDQLRQRLEDLEREVAERREAEKALVESEEQLRQAQKMEAVGRLAGGIAHDFNNLLTAINGYSGILIEVPDIPNQVRSGLEEIRHAGLRAASLTRQLLAFSRKQILKPEMLDINAVVSGSEKILRRLIGEDIEINCYLAPELDAVKADPGQLDQVIMNLAINARDAMPNGGKLTIETTSTVLEKHYVRNHPEVTPGSYVMLTISDSGIGMDESTRKRIFEPFFTTKGQGKGTGLGLSTVFGIIKQSGGHLTVYSEASHGSTFRIYLPSCGPCSSVPDSNKKNDGIPFRGSGNILLVEDEPQVRKLARTLLEKCGFRVLEADCGDTAVALAEKEQHLELMITDVIMPGCNGKEVFNQVSKLHSDLRVLFMSGYTDTAIVHHGVLDEGTNFIQKPFTPGAFWSKLREILALPNSVEMASGHRHS